MKKHAGFSLVELLIVVSIIGLMMTVVLPVSSDMYYRYKASLKAQELMVVISDLRQESFLYSRNHILSSVSDKMTIDGEIKILAGAVIHIDAPIMFYKNGTTSGGVINLFLDDYAFAVHIKPPMGDLHLEALSRKT